MKRADITLLGITVHFVWMVQVNPRFLVGRNVVIDVITFNSRSRRRYRGCRYVQFISIRCTGAYRG